MFKPDDYFKRLERWARKVSDPESFFEEEEEILTNAFESLMKYQRLRVHRVEPREVDGKMTFEEVSSMSK